MFVGIKPSAPKPCQKIVRIFKSSVAMAAQVGVVTTVGCPYCKKAKATLQEQGVQYAEAELGSARDVLAKVKETTGHTTVPQVCMLWLALQATHAASQEVLGRATCNRGCKRSTVNGEHLIYCIVALFFI